MSKEGHGYKKEIIQRSSAISARINVEYDDMTDSNVQGEGIEVIGLDSFLDASR